MSKDAWEYQEVKWALLFCSFSAFPELSSDELDHDYIILYIFKSLITFHFYFLVLVAPPPKLQGLRNCSACLTFCCLINQYGKLANKKTCQKRCNTFKQHSLAAEKLGETDSWATANPWSSLQHLIGREWLCCSFLLGIQLHVMSHFLFFFLPMAFDMLPQGKWVEVKQATPAATLEDPLP